MSLKIEAYPSVDHINDILDKFNTGSEETEDVGCIFWRSEENSTFFAIENDKEQGVVIYGNDRDGRPLFNDISPVGVDDQDTQERIIDAVKALSMELRGTRSLTTAAVEHRPAGNGEYKVDIYNKTDKSMDFSATETRIRTEDGHSALVSVEYPTRKGDGTVKETVLGNDPSGPRDVDVRLSFKDKEGNETGYSHQIYRNVSPDQNGNYDTFVIDPSYREGSRPVDSYKVDGKAYDLKGSILSYSTLTDNTGKVIESHDTVRRPDSGEFITKDVTRDNISQTTETKASLPGGVQFTDHVRAYDNGDREAHKRTVYSDGNYKDVQEQQTLRMSNTSRSPYRERGESMVTTKEQGTVTEEKKGNRVTVESVKVHTVIDDQHNWDLGRTIRTLAEDPAKAEEVDRYESDGMSIPGLTRTVVTEETSKVSSRLSKEGTVLSSTDHYKCTQKTTDIYHVVDINNSKRDHTADPVVTEKVLNEYWDKNTFRDGHVTTERISPDGTKDIYIDGTAADHVTRSGASVDFFKPSYEGESPVNKVARFIERGIEYGTITLPESREFRDPETAKEARESYVSKLVSAVTTGYIDNNDRSFISGEGWGVDGYRLRSQFRDTVMEDRNHTETAVRTESGIEFRVAPRGADEPGISSAGLFSMSGFNSLDLRDDKIVTFSEKNGMFEGKTVDFSSKGRTDSPFTVSESTAASLLPRAVALEGSGRKVELVDEDGKLNPEVVKSVTIAVSSPRGAGKNGQMIGGTTAVNLNVNDSGRKENLSLARVYNVRVDLVPSKDEKEPGCLKRVIVAADTGTISRSDNIANTLSYVSPGTQRIWMESGKGDDNYNTAFDRFKPSEMTGFFPKVQTMSAEEFRDDKSVSTLMGNMLADIVDTCAVKYEVAKNSVSTMAERLGIQKEVTLGSFLEMRTVRNSGFKLRETIRGKILELTETEKNGVENTSLREEIRELSKGLPAYMDGGERSVEAEGLQFIYEENVLDLKEAIENYEGMVTAGEYYSSYSRDMDRDGIIQGISLGTPNADGVTPGYAASLEDAGKLENAISAAFGDCVSPLESFESATGYDPVSKYISDFNEENGTAYTYKDGTIYTDTGYSMEVLNVQPEFADHLFKIKYDPDAASGKHEEVLKEQGVIITGYCKAPSTEPEARDAAVKTDMKAGVIEYAGTGDQNSVEEYLEGTAKDFSGQAYEHPTNRYLDEGRHTGAGYIDIMGPGEEIHMHPITADFWHELHGELSAIWNPPQSVDNSQGQVENGSPNSAIGRSSGKQIKESVLFRLNTSVNKEKGVSVSDISERKMDVFRKEAEAEAPNITSGADFEKAGEATIDAFCKERGLSGKLDPSFDKAFKEYADSGSFQRDRLEHLKEVLTERKAEEFLTTEIAPKVERLDVLSSRLQTISENLTPTMLMHDPFASAARLEYDKIGQEMKNAGIEVGEGKFIERTATPVERFASFRSFLSGNIFTSAYMLGLSGVNISDLYDNGKFYDTVTKGVSSMGFGVSLYTKYMGVLATIFLPITKLYNSAGLRMADKLEREENALKGEPDSSVKEEENIEADTGKAEEEETITVPEGDTEIEQEVSAVAEDPVSEQAELEGTAVPEEEETAVKEAEKPDEDRESESATVGPDEKETGKEEQESSTEVRDEEEQSDTPAYEDIEYPASETVEDETGMDIDEMMSAVREAFGDPADRVVVPEDYVPVQQENLYVGPDDEVNVDPKVLISVLVGEEEPAESGQVSIQEDTADREQDTPVIREEDVEVTGLSSVAYDDDLVDDDDAIAAIRSFREEEPDPAVMEQEMVSPGEDGEVHLSSGYEDDIDMRGIHELFEEPQETANETDVHDGDSAISGTEEKDMNIEDLPDTAQAAGEDGSKDQADKEKEVEVDAVSSEMVQEEHPAEAPDQEEQITIKIGELLGDMKEACSDPDLDGFKESVSDILDMMEDGLGEGVYTLEAVCTAVADAVGELLPLIPGSVTDSSSLSGEEGLALDKASYLVSETAGRMEDFNSDIMDVLSQRSELIDQFPEADTSISSDEIMQNYIGAEESPFFTDSFTDLANAILDSASDSCGVDIPDGMMDAVTEQQMLSDPAMELDYNGVTMDTDKGAPDSVFTDQNDFDDVESAVNDTMDTVDMDLGTMSTGLDQFDDSVDRFQILNTEEPTVDLPQEESATQDAVIQDTATLLTDDMLDDSAELGAKDMDGVDLNDYVTDCINNAIADYLEE